MSGAVKSITGIVQVRGWYPQTDYATDSEGTLRVDLLRFENLDSDSTQYFGLKHPIGK
jgi:hypothetical protein